MEAMARFTDCVRELLDAAVDLNQRIELINQMRQVIHQQSPMKHHPVDLVQWVPVGLVEPNEYNPNRVASRQFELLHDSVKSDGYTMPCVVSWSEDHFQIVDGFHRYRLPKERKDIAEMTCGFLPVATLDKPPAELEQSTVRHNEARGKHDVELTSALIRRQIEKGVTDSEICQHHGLAPDALHRLKQVERIADRLANKEYDQSWTVK